MLVRWCSGPRPSPHGILIVASIVAGCTRERELQILLGPDPLTVSQGFQCTQDADPSKLLLQRPETFDGTMVRFNLIVDFLDLGGALPGCRGEELEAACKSRRCELIAPGGERYCVPVAFGIALANDRVALMREITRQLRVRPITTNAPDRPVLIRAVATSQPCTPDVVTPVGGELVSLDPALAVGCAYSCPATLDSVSGPISLSLDTLDDRCELIVRGCAGFPDR
jgi:hypothetical protein